MARRLPYSSTDYLYTAGGIAGVGNLPCSLSAWVYIDDYHAVDAENGMIVRFRNSAATRYAGFRIVSGGASPCRYEFKGTGATPATVNIGTISTGGWNHFMGVTYGQNNHQTFLNGVYQNTSTQPTTNGSLLNYFESGFDVVAGTGGRFDGRLAHVAMWNVGMGYDEILALGKGVCPLHVRSQNLTCYFPLFAATSPDPDFRTGSAGIGVVGTVASTPGPANINPPFEKFFGVGAVSLEPAPRKRGFLSFFPA